MMLSEKQMVQLLAILYDSIRAKIEIYGSFGLDFDARVSLYNEIIQQQPEELKATYQ